jgi:membrane fusion protein (multidrug efflux system)
MFNNRNHLLRNGGSGTIIIPSEKKNCIVIPKTATYELQDRVFVYKVVNGKASATEIKVASQDNGIEYIVTDGLLVGDIIVAEGAGLIKEGTPIKSRTEEDAE